MSPQRDDFSQDTIRRAAMRVGYHCSFPGCKAATVGASMERNDKLSITGVAAHICAAAEGGPRYDPSMTREQRKSIDNCIWMCQTHSRLIDTDVKEYTVEKLKGWKSSAESAASAALANTAYFSEYYNSNQDNLAVIIQLFDDMIVDGQFSQLCSLLDQYCIGQLSEVYDELVFRYKIIFDTYCCRAKLKTDLNNYMLLPCKKGVEELAKLFIAFWLKDELGQIGKYCISEELNSIISLVLNGELEKKLFSKSSEETPHISVSQDSLRVIEKATVNYICINNLAWATDETGKLYNPHHNEFYYRTIESVHELIARSEYDNDVFAEICAGDELRYINDHISKIQILDPVLQEYIWSNLLTFLSADEKKFKSFYDNCPETIREIASVKRAKIINLIITDKSSVEIDEVLRFAEDNGYYDLVVMYLASIDKEAATKYLDEHSYLVNKDSRLLQLRLNLQNDFSTERKLSILIKVADRYSDDFLYHGLLAEISNDKQVIERELDWLQQHYYQKGIGYTLYYIKLLNNNNRWEAIDNLTRGGIYYSSECLYQMATFLAASEIKQFIIRGKEIYEALITQRKWKRRGLLFNLGLANQKLGILEAAKEYYQTEYNEFRNESALKQLIALRIETNVFLEDSYFDSLKECVDYYAQNLVGVVFFKRKNLDEAYKYFTRSLLLDDKDNPSLNGLMQISLAGYHGNPIDSVGQDTVCVLKNMTGHCIILAIHAPSILKGLSPNMFANCVHVSVENPSVSQLLFRETGDQVRYESQDYTVDSVCTTMEWFSKKAFSNLLNNPDSIAIAGSTPDKMIEQITDVLSSSTQNLDRLIKEYNESEMRLPLTAFSRITGKGMLATCEFIAYGNSERIRNNQNWLQEKDQEQEKEKEKEDYTFVLAYDSIVFLAHLELDSFSFEKNKLICAVQVKNQLVNDIDEELRSLSSKTHAASMFIKEGKIGIIEYTPEIRRGRYAFLTKLKEFVLSIPSPEKSYDYLPKSDVYKGAFSELILQNNLLCESGTLGLAQNMNNAVVVTDDQLLYNVASLDGINNIGLTGLLTYSCSEWERLLSASKNLHDINYLNYLPFPLYKEMVDVLIKSENNEAVNEGSAAIQQWVRTNTDNEASGYHEDVIIELARMVYLSGAKYLNPYNYLNILVINAIEKRKPGFLQECFNTTLQQMDYDIQQNGSVDCNESTQNKDE